MAAAGSAVSAGIVGNKPDDAPMVLDLSDLPIEEQQKMAQQIAEARARNAERVEAAAKAKKEKEIRLGEEIKSLELTQCQLRKMIQG